MEAQIQSPLVFRAETKTPGSLDLSAQLSSLGGHQTYPQYPSTCLFLWGPFLLLTDTQHITACFPDPPKPLRKEAEGGLGHQALWEQLEVLGSAGL